MLDKNNFVLKMYVNNLITMGGGVLKLSQDNFSKNIANVRHRNVV